MFGILLQLLWIPTLSSADFSVSVLRYPGNSQTYTFNRTIFGDCVLSLKEDISRCMRNHNFRVIEDQWRYHQDNIHYISVSCQRQEYYDTKRHICICKDGKNAASAKHSRQHDEFYYCQIRKLPNRMFSQLRNLTVLNLSDNFIADVEGDALLSVTSLRYLDLSRNPLRDLAAGFLCDSPEIETVIMKDTDFKRFPSHIFDCGNQLQNLTYIDVSDNIIDSIPSHAFKNIPNVQSLNFSSNNLSNEKLPPNAFVGLNELISVDLSENDLTFIPNGLCVSAPELKYLYMHENRFSLFNFHSLSGCTNITNLDLAHNDIKLLEGTVPISSNLLSLNLARNFIEAITSNGFLRNARKLKFLDLSMNSIGVISDSAFEGQRSLNILDISDNRLNNSLGAVFRHLRNLTHLDLSVNGITQIKSDLFLGLGNLKTLNLSRNLLVSVEHKAFDGLGNLRSIDLKYNGISVLPFDVFDNLKNINLIDLSQNNIHKLDNVAIPLSIARVDLTGNRLEHFPSCFSGSKLKEIIIDENEIQEIGKLSLQGLEHIQKISLSRNLISKVNTKSFNGLANLTHLNVSYNMLRLNFSENHFDGADSLKILDLTFNQINAINGILSFKSLKKLEEIHLTGNPIKYVWNLLPEVIYDDVFKDNNLRKIFLSSCNITYVDEMAFDGFANLSIVDLSNNRISSLRPFQTSNMNTDFYLNDNPLVCTCELRWLSERYVTVGAKKISMVHYNVKTCTILPTNFTMLIRSVPKSYFLCQSKEKCPQNCSCLAVSREAKSDVARCIGVRDVPTGIPKTAKRLYLDSNIIDTLDINENEMFDAEELFLNNSNIRMISRKFFSRFRNLRKLYLNGNNLENIPDNIFIHLNNLQELYLNNNTLTEIKAESLNGLYKLKLINLRDNNINYLDADILDKITKIPYLRRLFLGNNDWKCDCGNLNFRNWIDEHRSRIHDREDVKCGFAEQMQYIKPSSFFCTSKPTSPNQKGIIVSSVIIVCAVFVIIAIMIYYRRDVLAVLGSKFELNCLRHQYAETKIYDIFLLSDSKDQKGSEWTNTELLPRLNKCMGYNIVAPDYNVLVQSVTETESNKIFDSKCALFVITKYFFNNQYCNDCFQKSLTHARTDKFFKLIIVIVGDIELSIFPSEIHKFMSSGNYITARSRCVWDRLFFELPVCRPRSEPFQKDDDISEADVIIYNAATPGHCDDYGTVKIK